MYLTLFDYDRSLRENVKSKPLSPTAVLYNEPEVLLRTEEQIKTSRAPRKVWDVSGRRGAGRP
jgi:hypothetical protein